MKQCPHCSRTYTDDQMMFCLSDGSPLVAMYGDAEEPTVIRPPAPAVIPATGPGVSRFYKYLALGLLFVVLAFLGAGTALWMMWPSGSGERANAAVDRPADSTPEKTPAAKSTGTPQSQSSPESTPDPKPTPAEPKPAPAEPKPKPDAKTPSPPVGDPPAARITFGRGSMGESVSGTVARERSFVLRTLAGQSLSARVRSRNGCVVFANGSDSTAYSTPAGDSYLNIRNECDEPAEFRLRVNVR